MNSKHNKVHFHNFTPDKMTLTKQTNSNNNDRKHRITSIGEDVETLEPL